ncbi:arsenate reductase ArsC [Erysipelotrichaceae bacterium Oil+RF-744-GAM-WT-6]|uniref:Arsenate reductase ArsC n=1 Tax=Stecheria intestinalis TaxID=2606630 RepID=A0A7X2TGR5_9FIRM|nr:arsenate reductase ArsC [Stecheria intestinalis]MSS59013.1 arsenate reductase ArsC [Stecheria intestinalis]
MNKPRIAFICVHNSCRSQIAEALARQMAPEVLDSCSAGTNISGGINPDAIRLMKEMFGIDLIHAGQYPKMLSELPAIDIVVTMGCGVQCPNLPCRERYAWEILDPSGMEDEAFLRSIAKIQKELQHLLQESPLLQEYRNEKR